jgi:hypothetical protein
VTDVAPPGSVHPAYAAHATSLLNWLDELTSDHVEVAFPTSPTWSPDPDLYPPETKRQVLTRRKAYGLAPYVGRPFVYVWPVAVDSLGRQVAGRQTRIQHTMTEVEYLQTV